MGKPLDLTGQGFGRLVAVERLGLTKQGFVWRFACDCGETYKAAAKIIKSGHTRSCGCLLREHAKTGSITHGHAPKDGVTRTYRDAARRVLRHSGRQVMAFRICEDVGTTRRRKMTPSRALKIWEQHKGVCVLCKEPIDGVRDDWFIEHVRALENGGSDEDDNLGPAHLWHKATKDAEDHSLAARSKRIKRRHLGIKRRKGPPIPGSKDSPWKRKLDGTLVRRAR